MSAQVEMLSNQAQKAFDDAKRIREQMEAHEKAENTNIENAIESAEQEEKSGDMEQGRYWRQKADELRERLRHDLDKLRSDADSHYQQGKTYKKQASDLAEHESDDRKKGMLREIVMRVMDNGN